MRDNNLRAFQEAARVFCEASCRVALTGAGISVGSGIPDFRSTGGLWSRFDPDQFATLEAFFRHPEKAWVFYRELGRVLTGRRPTAAHLALARLERAGLLDQVLTQNIDGLHQAAGSASVSELHGSFRRLQCLACGRREPVRASHLDPGPIPRCNGCGAHLKPDVVLFGEEVREGEEAAELVERCDLLLLIGTSSTVYPVASYPRRVLRRGGCLLEFNLTDTEVSHLCRYRFPGGADQTVPGFVAAILAEQEKVEPAPSRCSPPSEPGGDGSD